MKKFLFLILILLSLNLSAQVDNQSQSVQDKDVPTMADKMRESGKIYVVVGVVAILFTGFMVYLITTDRKIKKLEREMDDVEEKLNRK